VVGTGLEARAALDSGTVVRAQHCGRGSVRGCNPHCGGTWKHGRRNV
jgi:hypothetical protein